MSLIHKDAITKLLEDANKPLTKAEIGRGVDAKGPEDRIALKKLLKEMHNNGELERTPSRRYLLPERLPLVSVIEIDEIDMDGDVFGTPVPWDEAQGPAPRVEVKSTRPGNTSFTTGERVLAKIRHLGDNDYIGDVIKRLSMGKNRIMGALIETKKGFLLRPVDKKARDEYPVPADETGGAKEGDIVMGELIPQAHKGLKKEARIVEIIGHIDDPKSISLIAIHENGLSNKFPDAVLKETEGLKVPPLGKRQDLRDLPLVTIDGADARDFDDAVFAEEDKSPKNKGGYHLIVAIADVSYYVRPESALDQEAYVRGNSTYFPDRVVPMLPEALSNDLCSLRPDEERASMAMHLWIDNEGQLIKYKPVRALIKSSARLTYEQVQAAKDGNPDEQTEPLMEAVIEPLYAAYNILDKAREKRGALDLDLPERQILINDDGEMTGVTKRVRLDAHKLIEEFMVLTNVAAARALEDKKATCIYRIHDKPAAERLDSVREFIEGFDLNFPKGQVVKPGTLNGLLNQAKDRDDGIPHLVSQIVLRSQSQAVYSKDNNGHFGLALTHYAHFTSPIRRYADLIVHRSMIRAYGFGDDGVSDGEIARAAEIADHISTTERKSMVAERSAVDRFTASYLSDKVGAEFTGRISGVTRFGIFVTLDENGADGIIPVRSLNDDYYIHDEEQHALIGRKTRKVYRLCAPITVRLKEADGMTGSTVLEVVGNKGADIPGFKPKKKSFRSKKKYDKENNRNRSNKSSYSNKKKKKKTMPKHKRKKNKN